MTKTTTKYKLKIDYIAKEEEVRAIEPLIRKGEILEVVGYSEPIQSVVCFYKGGIQINIPLQAFLLIAEEYHELPKRKICHLCKHYEKCLAIIGDSPIFAIGDFCARFDEIESREENL